MNTSNSDHKTVRHTTDSHPCESQGHQGTFTRSRSSFQTSSISESSYASSVGETGPTLIELRTAVISAVCDTTGCDRATVDSGITLAMTDDSPDHHGSRVRLVFSVEVPALRMGNILREHMRHITRHSCSGFTNAVGVSKSVGCRNEGSSVSEGISHSISRGETHIRSVSKNPFTHPDHQEETL